MFCSLYVVGANKIRLQMLYNFVVLKSHRNAYVLYKTAQMLLDALIEQYM